MTATAMNGAGWSCNIGATSSCTRTDALAAGAAYPAITLTVRVANDAPSSVTNVATVSGGSDTNGSNNTASDVTTVVAGPTARSFVVTMLAGTTKSVDLTVGSTGGPFSSATLISLTPSSAGTATISASGGTFILTFTPAATFTGSAVVTFTLSTAVATTAPATVTFSVVARSDPSKDPEVIGLITAQIAAAERFANAQMMNFNQRLESLHEDGYGSDRNGISLGAVEPRTANSYVAEGYSNLGNGNAPGSLNKAEFERLFASVDPKSRLRGDNPGPDIGPRRNLSFWTSGYVNFGSADEKAPGSGFEFNTSGVSIGADYRFSPTFVAGIGLGYGRDRSTIGANGTETRSETYSFSIYESYRPFKGTFIDGILGFGTLNYDSRRFVTDSGDFAFSTRNGKEWFASLTAGYEYRTKRLLLAPYARIKAVWLTLNPFTETGDPTGSLTYSQQDASTITGVLGLRGKYDLLMDWGVVSPRFRVEYNRAFQNGGLLALNYADWIGGPTYFMPGWDASRDFVTLGLGTDIRIPNNTFVNFDYQTTLNAFDTHSHLFKLKVGRKY
jgi:outer membrane autotransporter protein